MRELRRIVRTIVEEVNENTEDKCCGELRQNLLKLRSILRISIEETEENREKEDAKAIFSICIPLFESLYTALCTGSCS